MKRRLSIIERPIWLGGQVVPINFAMMTRISGAFSNEQLHAALARVRERYPLAAVRVVVDEAQGLCFVSEGVPALPVRVLTDCGDTDWIAVVREELGEPFPWETGPFVRFVLLRGPDFSDLVAVYHHGICDGMSGAYLLRDVLRLLGEPDAELAPLPPPPDLWTLIPTSVTANPRIRLQMGIFAAMFRITRLWQRLRRRVLPKTAAHPAAPTSGDLTPWKRFCVLAWALTEAQTAVLIAGCRAEGVSVHAAICAAWLLAFAPIQAGRKSWVRKVSSPVNLRNRLSPPLGEAFGLFMSNVETAADCAPGRDFWEVARDLKRELERGSTDEKVFVWLLLMRSVLSTISDADMRTIMAEFTEQRISYDFSITNLGRLDFPVQVGRLRVEAMYGPAVNTCEQERTVGITTIGGRMFFTFTFRDFVLDPVLAEQFKAQAMARLGAAVGW